MPSPQERRRLALQSAAGNLLENGRALAALFGNESAAQSEDGVKKTSAASTNGHGSGLNKPNKPIICKLCQMAVVAKGDNTSKLFNHLKSKHILEEN